MTPASEIVDVSALSARIIAEVERAVVGKRLLLEQIMAALLAGGHVLLEDYPGLAKTLIANSFATALGLQFKRIQFTPDLLPGDITGGFVYDRSQNTFALRKGPLFANIILADEINRASPKTQSALLEAMQEHQVTLEGETMALPQPFIVFATQNPIEYEGTFPLPEAQLDRFMLRLRMGYPEPADEMLILDEQKRTHPVDGLTPVANAHDVLGMQRAVREIYVDPAISDYIVRLVGATRAHPDVYLGASPRGSLALYRASQALASLTGRDYVIPDDVLTLAPQVLAHRLLPTVEASMSGRTTEVALGQILSGVPMPESRRG